jgi:hypothetical protein
MKLSVSVKAGLRREEVIAVVLYTGPMVDAAAQRLAGTQWQRVLTLFFTSSIPASRIRSSNVALEVITFDSSERGYTAAPLLTALLR